MGINAKVRGTGILGAAFLCVAMLVGCQPAGDALPSDDGPTNGWQAIPAAPISGRQRAAAFWTGSEVLVLGGQSALPQCLGECFTPDGPIHRDGAAYVVATRTWRSISAAPVDLLDVTGAWLGGSLYLWAPDPAAREQDDGAFLRYRVAEDRWERLPDPATPVGPGVGLVATASRVLLYSVSQEGGVSTDQAFDPVRGSWADVPVDPLAPAFDRVMVWTGRELVLLGIRLDPNHPPNAPHVYGASVLGSDGAWARIRDSEISGSSLLWAFAGGLLVNPDPGGGDGGEVGNWGRRFPVGGTLTPGAWSWGSLPDLPAGQDAYSNWDSGYRGLSAAGSTHLVDPKGWVLNAVTRSWTALVRPPSPAHEGGAVTWAGDRLVVWGGIGSQPDGLRLLNSGWIWTP